MIVTLMARFKANFLFRDNKILSIIMIACFKANFLFRDNKALSYLRLFYLTQHNKLHVLGHQGVGVDLARVRSGIVQRDICDLEVPFRRIRSVYGHSTVVGYSSVAEC